MNPAASWNLVQDLRLMLSYPFMVNAVRAGTIVAVVAGAVGWVMVLRRESFAGHTLAVVGFPGAAAATWLGIAVGYGYFGICITAALVIAALPRSVRSRSGGEQSAVIGTVQAFALAAGMLFVSLYKGFLSGLTNLLFGTIAGVTDEQVTLLLVAAVPCLTLLAMLGRPLLWASIDSETAAAQGIPVRIVGACFLVLLGVAAAGTSQVTGSLLVFTLLVAPAAAAHQLATRPGRGIVVSIAIALAVTWAGMGCAFFSSYPIGFWVSTFAFSCYLLSLGWRRWRDRGRARASFRRADRSPVEVTA
ncbi:metal ABC transporter permease [Nocardia pseudobrasiliensis]|uniref:Zinc/manganese transport system permease protein n=1 Tax=Nocardia pseudobrasiliensis TaxID=45979 RepID=A0A370HS24_9NOCA|nr:iron chelate uptake ABC transporter family permease subunit [Nocardia pseudobrasiliensis]RDI61327.1 zinc/manganese transport system permease protein [Nocardia pseudobrasiliensis]